MKLRVSAFNSENLFGRYRFLNKPLEEQPKDYQKSAQTFDVKTRLMLCRAIALASLCLSSTIPLAQSFPSKTIRLTVPFAAGGTTDAVARVLAPRMEKIIGQPVVVENHPGAAGATGFTRTVKSSPDGYDVLLGGAEVVREGATQLAAVGLIGTTPSVIVVRQNFSGQLKDQRSPIGAFSARYADGLLLRELSKSTPVRFETYRGSGAAITDLAAGQLDLFVGDYMSVKALVEAGRAKVIAASSQPPNVASRIPSFGDAGVPPLKGESFLGLFAPKGTPENIIAKLSETLTTALRTDEVSRQLADVGIVVKPGGAESLQGVISSISASIPNPCKIKSECEKDRSCNPPECPAN
jgi:tripartite-type tricarboxylate transporter receptor subunit TctC